MRVRGKTLLCLAISLAMVMSFTPAVKAETASMKVIFELSDTTELLPPLSPGPCNNFTIQIKIFGVSNLWSWKARVTWDPAILEVAFTGLEWMIYEGPFLQPDTLFLFSPPHNDLGEITEMSCTRLTATGKTGDGILAYVTFHVKKFTPISGTYINLVDVVCLDPAKNPITIDPIVPGLFINPPPPPTPPSAKFTPADCTFVTTDTNVTLDASESTSGWDASPESHECPITEYRWDIDLFNDGTIEYTKYGVSSWYKSGAPGFLNVAITLTVIAPDPSPPTDPRYVDHDSEKHVIHEMWPCGWPWAFDVYTEKGGIGSGGPIDDPNPYPWAWSDAFGPQEEITIYALITHYKEPVENKPVAFEIKDPNGTTRDYRTAFTDASGIATTTMRIPWEGSGAEDLFGDWAIIGIADVAETILSDICKFRFGYIVSIRDIQVSGAMFKKGQNLGVTVDIKNIAYHSKDVFVTIVLHDECNVTIGLRTIDFMVDPDDGLTAEQTMTIPSWAFVGTGHVYVNIYTKAPAAGGTPMCPEGSAVFIIQKTADP